MDDDFDFNPRSSFAEYALLFIGETVKYPRGHCTLIWDLILLRLRDMHRQATIRNAIRNGVSQVIRFFLAATEHLNNIEIAGMILWVRVV